ncbi:hypothetical protein [uncultured Prevotella sp.]|uniref:hypothetical protein n=1 Tax=uncultured Prevotella sp. TaxID=159272 RepID=UPI002594B175|nr:hypothetical protein [uncultured Prevotella sp.]
MADVTIEPEVDEQQRNIKSYSAVHQSYGLKQESPCLQISHELGCNSVVCIFMNCPLLSADLRLIFCVLQDFLMQRYKIFKPNASFSTIIFSVCF